MAGFKGQAEYSVDEKGRVALPAKMRRVVNPEAQDMFVATRGQEQCIFVYPQDTWEKLEDELQTLNLYQTHSRNFIRILYRWAEDISLDRQGRITLPKRLLEFAGISGTAVIIGALDKIEIWDPEVLDQTLNSAEEDYETVTERVMGGMGQ